MSYKWHNHTEKKKNFKQLKKIELLPNSYSFTAFYSLIINTNLASLCCNIF